MITNEKQYRITQKKLTDLGKEINRIKDTREDLPAKDLLILASLQTMEEQLRSEIGKYESLKSKGLPWETERSIDSLPDLLIEFKIRSGMTQKDFAAMIGIKEQQLQRYEAENFSGISFKNLLKILHAVGLPVTIKANIS